MGAPDAPLHPETKAGVMAPTDSPQWISRFNPDPGHEAVLQAMAVAPDGAVIAAGRAMVKGRPSILTMKYRP